MLDYLDEIESDFSVFHRERHPRLLDAPRFFRLARLLPCYDGAVRQALARDAEPAPSHGAPPSQAAQGPDELPDITSIVALSQQPGFPSIAYTSGG